MRMRDRIPHRHYDLLIARYGRGGRLHTIARNSYRTIPDEQLPNSYDCTTGRVHAPPLRAYVWVYSLNRVFVTKT
jgi:hypothetical protein